MTTTFETLQVDARLVRLLSERSISVPTPVQQQAIPAALQGKDIVAQSQTGTGKTLAYILPILQCIKAAAQHLQAVIIVPTRELAMQIAAELEYYGRPLGVAALPLIGGASLSRQVEKLKLHPQVVVGTPGRLAELVRAKKLKLHQVGTVVVDEVDQVFALGETSQVEQLLKQVGRERQMMFFSATVPETVEQLADKWMNQPIQLRIAPEQRLAETLQHGYFLCEARDKIETLRKLVRLYAPERAMVFVNGMEQVAEIVSKLKFGGLAAEALYGDQPKLERVNVLSGFRQGRHQLLVSTDVAARGLDVAGLPVVFNFDYPPGPEHYIHRAGRTGRMGQRGIVLTLVEPREQYLIRRYERTLGIAIQSLEMRRGEVAERNAAAEHPRVEARTTHSKKPVSKETPGKKQAATPNGGNDAMVSVPKKAVSAKQAVPSHPPKRATVRKENSKDKGAPKWLKEKRAQSSQSQLPPR